MHPNVSDAQTVIGPVITREGGYAFDLWTSEDGMIRGFSYRRIEDACYARKYEIKWRPENRTASCSTLDEFTGALSRSRCVAEGPI